MKELSEEETKGKILHKLARWKKFGQVYTDKRDAVKGFPSHLINQALEAVDEMVKKRLLLPWKKGKCVSINIREREEVDRLIKLFLESKFNV